VGGKVSPLPQARLNDLIKPGELTEYESSLMMVAINTWHDKDERQLKKGENDFYGLWKVFETGSAY